MTGDEDTYGGDYVLSEKIITESSETEKAYSLKEKYDPDEKNKHVLELTDSKDRKFDAEHQVDTYLQTQEDLDIAIINEVTLTEDDVNMKCLTFRAILVGAVSDILVLDILSTELTFHLSIIDSFSSQFLNCAAHAVQAYWFWNF